jgi:peptidoglycan hydrolase FlgJ
MDNALSTQVQLSAMQATAPRPETFHAMKQGRMSDEKINQAAADFEAMFLSQMMQPMWETVPIDEGFGGGAGEETFRGFAVQEYGKLASRSPGGLGIAEHVKAELMRMQEQHYVP